MIFSTEGSIVVVTEPMGSEMKFKTALLAALQIHRAESIRLVVACRVSSSCCSWVEKNL
jgi:hypothetical protein